MEGLSDSAPEAGEIPCFPGANVDTGDDIAFPLSADDAVEGFRLGIVLLTPEPLLIEPPIGEDNCGCVCVSATDGTGWVETGGAVLTLVDEGVGLGVNAEDSPIAFPPFPPDPPTAFPEFVFPPLPPSAVTVFPDPVTPPTVASPPFASPEDPPSASPPFPPFPPFPIPGSPGSMD